MVKKGKSLMIENVEIREFIAEILNTLHEGCSEVSKYIESRKYEKATILVQDIKYTLQELYKETVGYKESHNINVSDACICIVDSVTRVERCMVYNPDKACEKLRFETIPMIKIAYIQYRYWGCAYQSEEGMKEFEKEKENFYINESVKAAVKKGKEYKYELSIMVLGYNHVDYTKTCVESILQYAPKDISYELILVNHGSTDGTKDYYESVYPTKQLDITVNGALPLIAYAPCEGKYILSVSNDVIVTPNAITNLMKLIREDETIGWAVPSTSNISNLQTLPVEYTNFQEMQEFAKENNAYDETRHEQRVRLCNPISIFRAEVINRMYMELYSEMLGVKDKISFPDDKASLWFRRNGYKSILAKDAYCHHGGSITLKDEIAEKNPEKFYLEGRKAFYRRFGVDPWGTGMCFSVELLELVEWNIDRDAYILGINCGLGSNPLKIRETLKEKKSVKDKVVYNFTDVSNYCKDLEAVSDEVFEFTELADVMKKVENIKFNYIIIEDDFSAGTDKAEAVRYIMGYCKPKTQIFVKIDEKDVKKMEGFFGEIVYNKPWIKICSK